MIRSMDGDQALCRYKLILLGEAGVGKTSLWHRFKTGECPKSGMSSIGVDIATKQITMSDGNGSGKDEVVELNLWDTGGGEMFRRDSTHCRSYFRSVHGIFFVFSLDRVESLRRLEDWITDALMFSDSPVCLFLCNKTDLPDEDRLLCRSDIDGFLAMCGSKFEVLKEHMDACLFHTSAKLPMNIAFEKAVDSMTRLLHNKTRALKVPQSDTVRLGDATNQQPKRSAGCDSAKCS